MSGEDGFEVLRRMHLQFGPKLVIRQGQVLANFVAMISRPAKSIVETRTLLTDMDRTLKLIRCLTSEGYQRYMHDRC